MECLNMELMISQSQYNENEVQRWVENTSQARPASDGKYFCPLCPESHFNKTTKEKLKNHLYLSHDKHAVVTKGLKCAPCFNKCHPGKTETHYHCPCGKLIVRKSKYKIHLLTNLHELLLNTRNDPSATFLKPPEEPFKPASNLENENGATKAVEGQCEPRKAKRKMVRVDCLECGKNLSKVNLRRHMREVHKSTVQQSRPTGEIIVVSAKEGLYLVPQNLNEVGNRHPIHVKNSVSSINQKIFCESGRCQDASNAYKRGAISTFSCEHIVATNMSKNIVHPKQVQIKHSNFDELIEKGIVGENSRKNLTDILHEAEGKGEHLALHSTISPSSSLIYISVFCSKTHYYAKLGRLVVRFCSQTGKFNCPCLHTRKTCTHIEIAKCHIFLNNPQLLQAQKTNIANLDFSGEGDKVDESVVSDATSESTEISGCLQRDKVLAYLRQYKSIPVDFDKVTDAVFPSTLQPTEKICPICTTHPILDEPQHVTKAATIYDLDDVHTGISVYTKKCPECMHIFHYMEHNDGLHNYNSHTILSLRLCKFLRSCIQNHIAIGRFAEVLSSAVGKKYPSNLLAAYLHFEAFSEHQYEFECDRCGHFPSVLTLDANHKLCFPVEAETLMNIDDCNEEVDMRTFWKEIEDGIISKGNQRILPKLSYWAPWISPNNVSGTVLNTEFQKVVPTEDLHDQDEQDAENIMSDDYLDILLCEAKLKEIREIAKEMNISDKGTKLDMISRIQKEMKKKSIFQKKFQKLWGRTGGFLVATCPHGVTCAFKSLLRAESVRDHVDLLMSLKHRPTVTVNDMSNMTSRHANKRMPGFFHPHLGRLDEATEINLARIGTGSFEKSMPFLKHSDIIFEDIEDHSYISKSVFHPVTRTSDHYMLSDEFHKHNLSAVEDKLRDASLVPELRGCVNTETAEQLFSQLNKDVYFMNSMNPGNHMFVLRLLLHLRNNKINAVFRNTLQKNKDKNVTIMKAPDGRVCMKPCENMSKSSGMTGEGNAPVQIKTPGPLESPDVNKNSIDEDWEKEIKSPGPLESPDVNKISIDEDWEKEEETKRIPEQTVISVDADLWENVEVLDSSDGTNGKETFVNKNAEKSEDVKIHGLPKPQESSVSLYCLCKKPYDNRQEMIQCSKCEQWYHPSCIGMSKKTFRQLSIPQATYNCTSCMASGDSTHSIGLHNFGQSCWLNSSLQALKALMDDDMELLLLQSKKPYAMDIIDFIQTMKKTPSGTVLWPQGIKEPWPSLSVTTTPTTRVDSSVPRFKSPGHGSSSNKEKVHTWSHAELSNRYGQKDAAEFLNVIFENLDALDYPQTQWQTKFLSCQHESMTSPVKEYILQLPVSTYVQGSYEEVRLSSVQECVNAHLNFTELLSGESVCSCGNSTPVERKLVLTNAPEVLVLALKRFSFTSLRTRKISRQIEINRNILLSEGLSYNLTSLICHSGSSPMSGHYVKEDGFRSHCSLSEQMTVQVSLADYSIVAKDETITTFNDTVVKRMNIAMLKNKNFQAEVYVLLYRKSDGMLQTGECPLCSEKVEPHDLAAHVKHHADVHASFAKTKGKRRRKTKKMANILASRKNGNDSKMPKKSKFSFTPYINKMCFEDTVENYFDDKDAVKEIDFTEEINSVLPYLQKLCMMDHNLSDVSLRCVREFLHWRGRPRDRKYFFGEEIIDAANFGNLCEKIKEKSLAWREDDENYLALKEISILWPVCAALQKKFQESKTFIFEFVNEVLVKEALIQIFMVRLNITEDEVRTICTRTEKYRNM